jgi:predicted Fe-Mo cluster-binding NifX family protein
MKIAIARHPHSTTLGPFGQGSELDILELRDGQVVATQPVKQTGGCCGGLAMLVRGADVVLCDGIGHGALHHLTEQGTPVARPKQSPSEVNDVVRLWLAGDTSAFFSRSDDCDHPPCKSGSNHHHE